VSAGRSVSSADRQPELSILVIASYLSWAP
jgi:hypothetical protein